MSDLLEKAGFRPIVGIDLGTTNSAVACIKGGKPKLLASPTGETIIPSVVLVDLKGKVIVGKDAQDALVAMPDRSIAAVKRRMGSREPISLAGQSYLPQEVSALILKELKSYVDAEYGDGEKEAVITVPAYFSDEQRRATKEAGELAGFVVERIINEPTAAALAFGLQNMDEDRHILVYDLGGGTFDVSVVEMMSGILEVKASTGNRMLGGEDFDWRLVDWFAEHMIEQHGVDPREDIRAKALLKREAEEVKKQLSDKLVTEVELPLVTVNDNKPVGLSIQVTRAKFEQLIDDLLTETMDGVHRVLKDAGVSVRDIDEILLVGGSTRIPRVRQLVKELFEKEPLSSVHPDEAVALGAAVQAGLKSGALSNSGLVATDVAPFSMGIATLKQGKGGVERPGGFAPIIPRNTTIPVTRSQIFYTAAPGQTKVEIEIYQGEHEWVKHNHLLGEYLMEGIPVNHQAPEEIEVTFRYNLNGILEVASKCISTGQAMTVTVQDALIRSSQDSYEESVAKLEALWSGELLEEADEEEEEFMSEEDWDLLDLIADNEVDELEEASNDELAEQVHRLRRRAEELMKDVDGGDSLQLMKIIRLLDDAVQSDESERMEQAIDEAADLLIDLEL